MSFYRALPVVISAMAVWMDFKSASVDNGWILFSFVTGFLIQFTEKGLRGGFVFLAGASTPVIILGILFIFRMLGAGDIKLLCALGGIMGPRTVADCIFYSLLAGAGISMAILISTGGIRQRFLYFFRYMNEFYVTGEMHPYYRKGTEFPENFHFTVPIFLSAVLYAGGVY